MSKVTALRSLSALDIAASNVEFAEMAERAARAAVDGNRTPEVSYNQACAFWTQTCHELDAAKRRLQEAKDIAEQNRSAEDRRKALAAAIADARAAEAAAESGRAAVRHATDGRSRAEEALIAASNALADAKAKHANGAEEAAKSGATVQAGVTIRKARADEIDAQDDLDAISAALGKLRDQQLDLEHTSRRAAAAVAAAADGIVSLAVAGVVSDIELLRNQLEDRRDILSFLSGCAIDQLSKDLIQRTLSRGLRLANPYGVACTPWRFSREALHRSADASLPS